MRRSGTPGRDATAPSRSHVLRALGLAGLLAGAMLQTGQVRAAGSTGATTTFVVNTTFDTLACSKVTTLPLRCAIRAANAVTTPGPIAITFNIPPTDKGCAPQTINGTTVTVCTIQPLSDFHELTSADTIIDGYTQPGAVANTNPMGSPDNAILTVQLDGTQDTWNNRPYNNEGILLYGQRETVSGLSITNFANTTGSAIGAGIRSANASNVISGDWLGVSPTGVVGGSDEGAAVLGAANTIGGTSRASRNVISGNRRQGIAITSSRNRVEGNYIGTDPTGSAAMGNGTGTPSSGIGFIGTAAADNVIGGAGPSTRNIISASSSAGIGLGGNVGNTISGNYIGTNASGTAALPNATEGVLGQGSSSNVIGGTVTGTGNLISGNTASGIELLAGSNNTVEGNILGLNFAHAALPNGGSGVYVHGGEHSDVIGGIVAGAGNTIAGNSGAGVKIGAFNSDTSTAGIAVEENRISGNGAPGIVLSGQYMPHCSTGGTTGPNDYFLCPVITSASTTAAGGTVAPNSRVEVFLATNEPSSQVHGSGIVYLGSTTADGTGNWHVTYNQALTAGQFVTATATGTGPSNAGPETSEYAQNLKVS